MGDATLGFTLQAKGYAIYSFSTPLNVPFSETLGAALDFGLTCTVGGLYVGLSWQYPHAAQANLPLGQPTLTALTMLGTTGPEGLVRLDARATRVIRFSGRNASAIFTRE